MEKKQKIHKNWDHTYIVPLKKENISQLNVTIIIISLWIVWIFSHFIYLRKAFLSEKGRNFFYFGEKKVKYFDLPNMAEVGIN
jgi:hypothetical protein